MHAYNMHVYAVKYARENHVIKKKKLKYEFGLKQVT